MTPFRLCRRYATASGHCSGKSQWILLCGIGIIGLSIASGTKALYMNAKAHLAQHLLERAWQHSLEHQRPTPPWRWADSKAVAKLSHSGTDKHDSQSFIVLDNASGEAMAFGPGLAAGKIHDADASTVVIGGHRDTHLSFLQYANQDTRFTLQLSDGRRFNYRFETSYIIDSQIHELQVAINKPGLVLVTCYPFNALQTGGPLRLVVQTQLIDT